MSAAIELRGVDKEFWHMSPSFATSSERAQGERHALIGPNGRRQIDTFNLISGYMAPTGQRAAPGPGHLRPAALSDQPPRPVGAASRSPTSLPI